MFSLFIDRLEEFVQQRVGDWTRGERRDIMIAGLAIPLLLFADDIVLASRSRDLVQRLLNALRDFCAVTGFTVNLDKTVWLVGGEVPADFAAGELFYGGSRLKRVADFRYLGLVMSGHSVASMVAARETAARRAWG